jgi:YVTN family beta-propeller protein
MERGVAGSWARSWLVLIVLVGRPLWAATAVDDLPLAFEPNQGQTASSVRFLARGGGYTLWLTADEAVLGLNGAGGAPPATLRLRFLEAMTREVAGLESLPGRSRYFVGATAADSPTDVPHYGRVRYEGVYPGIDLEYYGNRRQLEHDLIVAPGADAAAVRFRVEGAERTALDAGGDLVFTTAAGDVHLRRPFAYQEAHGETTRVECGYALGTSTDGATVIGFAIGDYDHTRTLVIDPVVVYSTYVGGSGYESGYDVVADGGHNVYVTGATRSVTFPVASAAQGTFAGGHYDAFVLKLNADATQIVYSTFLGGSADDYGYGLAVDPAGAVSVAGGTFSPDFHPAQSTPNAYQHFYAGGGDAFFVRLNPDGQLVYGTWLGGSDVDLAFDVALDRVGIAYLTGYTASANFPTAAPFQPQRSGNRDAFVTKIDPSQPAPTQQLVYSTYLGGSGQEDGWGIATGGSLNAYVTGQTCSSDFPRANRSPLQNTPGGACDAFVAKLNEAGSDLVYSTYLGGSGWDKANAIAVDLGGEAHVAGETTSTNFPGASLSPIQNVHGGGQYDAFVARVNSAGSALGYATYLGGTGDDYATDVTVDGGGAVYTTGYTTSTTGFPTMNALQPAFGGGAYDAFLTGIDPAGSALVQSTYVGGKADDFGMGVALDSAGAVYLSGHTASLDFPVTQTIPGATAAPRAYVTGESGTDGRVTVINTADNTVEKIVPVAGGIGLLGVTVGPDGGHVYVSNTLQDRVTLIDAGNFATTTVPVVEHPKGLAVHPRAPVLYVGNSQTSHLTPLHSATLSPFGGVQNVGSYPAGIAVSADGTRAYVADGNDITPEISVLDLDPATGQVLQVGAWPTGNMPSGIAVTPDGTRVYVALMEEDAVAAYDTASGQPIGDKIPVGDYPNGVALHPDGKHLYVANQLGNSFSVVDTDPASPNYHKSVEFTLPGTPQPVGVSLTPDGQQLYITNSNQSSVTVVDTATNNIAVPSIGVDKKPWSFGSFIGPRMAGGDVFVTKITP